MSLVSNLLSPKFWLGMVLLSFISAGLLFFAKLGLHADMTHFDDASQGRNCYNKYGSFETWQERTTGEVHNLCRYPNEPKIYDVIVKLIKKTTWEEDTTYVPGNGSYQAVKDFLHNVTRKAIKIDPKDLPVQLPKTFPHP
jgi:hypothetical protein